MLVTDIVRLLSGTPRDESFSALLEREVEVIRKNNAAAVVFCFQQSLIRLSLARESAV